MKDVSSFLQKGIFYLFILLFLLTPLVFYPFTKYFPFPWFIFNVDPFTYELFEYNKMYLVYGIAIGVGTLWAARCVAEGRVIFRRTFPDYALALFLLSQVLSTIYSIDQHTSIWGYYSRFHGGLLSTISYLLLYWAFVSNLFEKKFAHSMLITSIISATLVSIYGVAQHFGVDAEFWVQNVRARVFSSLGQPNWLAAYLVAVFPIAFSYFLYERRTVHKSFYFISCCSIFLSVIYTGSRSGLLALVIGMVIYAVLVYTKRLHESKHRVYSTVVSLALAGLVVGAYLVIYNKYSNYALTCSLVLLGLSFALLIYVYSSIGRWWVVAMSCVLLIFGFVYLSPEAFRLGSAGVAQNTAVQETVPLEAGGTETGRIRFIVWGGAVEIFKRFPVLGSGVESFAYAFYQNRPLELLNTTEWDFLYNKAHNEYLNFLATTGVFGLGIYVMYILFFLFFALKFYVSYKHLSFVKHDESLIQSKHSKKSKTSGADVEDENYAMLISIGILCGFITILVTNFFGFSVVVVALYFFLFSALLAVLASHERGSFLYKQIIGRVMRLGDRRYEIPSSVRSVSYVLIGFLFLFMMSKLISFWLADIAFSKGRSLNRQAQIGQAQKQFLEAIALRDDEPFYYSELGWTQSNMVYALMKQNDASVAAELVPIAEENSRRAVEMSPQNINYWKKLADTYYNLTFFDNELYKEKLLQTSDRTQTLAPTDVSTLLTLAIYYEEMGKLDTAQQMLERSTEWKPDFADGWYRLGNVHYQKYKTLQSELDKNIAEECRYKATQLQPAKEEFKRAYE